MAKCKPFLQIISSELEYVPHRAKVATGELAGQPRQCPKVRQKMQLEFEFSCFFAILYNSVEIICKKVGYVKNM